MSAPVDIKTLVAMLARETRAVVAEIFRTQKVRGARFQIGSLAGEDGQSLSVILAGHRAGAWRDFATGEHGDILDLVAQALFSGDKRQAVRWARSFLRLDDLDHRAFETQRREAERDRARADKQAERDRARRRSVAWMIWGQQATPELAGTPVESYLRSRGIELQRLKSHGALRYHSGLVWRETGELFHGMVAAIVGPAGKFAAVHRTFLEPDGAGGWVKAQLGPKKRAKFVLGDALGGYVSLSKGASGLALTKAPIGDKVIITEGIEDGLTLAMAAPEWRVIAAYSLSNMAALADTLPPEVATVLLYRDNDTAPHAIAGFAAALRAHQDKRSDVRVAQAPGAKDANELLMRGLEGAA